MGSWVMSFQEIDRTKVASVGGKGAHLGELSRLEGVCVPPGFCVTTAAFQRIMAQARLGGLLERIERLSAGDREGISAASAEIRQILEGAAIDGDLAAEIGAAYARLGEQIPCAVRSSATAEDLPTASFAGQQDTFLQVIGLDAILQRVRLCLGSLFSERAVTYRLRNKIDGRKVHMAVVVQQMVSPQASGVLFTADPLTSHRKIVSVEAVFGLGEALVSGLVTPDVYKVRDGEIIERRIAKKALAIEAAPRGGTQRRSVGADLEGRPALSDTQVVHLARIGRQIEAHLGLPQDIEWALADGVFQIVQSRPITALFPIPEVGDGEIHVYVSVGHQQMMTDPIKPLGLSLFQLTAGRPMYEAGGRLFVDVARQLGSPSGRAAFLSALGRSDPLIGDALERVLARGDLIEERAEEAQTPMFGAPPASSGPDPSIVGELIARDRAAIETLEREIASKSGLALIDFVLEDVEALKRSLSEPQSYQALMAGMGAALWLREHLSAWLGEKGAADTLAQSAPHNITAEMGLDLLRLADVIRPHPEVVAALRRAENSALEGLAELPGGVVSREAILAYLDKYGMRCVGEIDITRPRFREDPAALLPALLGCIDGCAPGAAEQRYARGEQEALRKEQEVLARLRSGPEGEPRAEKAKQMIDRLRAFIGYREHPKYAMICRYFVYKRALLRAADPLVQAGVLSEPQDIYYLSLQELREVVRSQRADGALIEQRKEAFRAHQAVRPPRVMTSEGEVITGSYRRDDLPPGVLIGLPVSAGIVEGRARVVLDMAKADLRPGDILVTAYTDPSWTPLFVSIGGLVTEVGGLMTHGAVIAREYGLPAVVGVEQATRRIEDGQQIRLNGTEGTIEILSGPQQLSSRAPLGSAP